MRLGSTTFMKEFILKMKKHHDIHIDRIVSPSTGMLNRYLKQNCGEIDEILVVRKMKGGDL